MPGDLLPWLNVILAAMYVGLALNYIATRRGNRPRTGVVMVTMVFVIYVGIGYGAVALDLRSYVTLLVHYLTPMISILLAALIANLVIKR